MKTLRYICRVARLPIALFFALFTLTFCGADNTSTVKYSYDCNNIECVGANEYNDSDIGKDSKFYQCTWYCGRIDDMGVGKYVKINWFKWREGCWEKGPISTEQGQCE